MQSDKVIACKLACNQMRRKDGEQMRVIMMYSEAGGVSKSTSSVSVATICAREFGMDTVLIDLDPRGAATSWLGVEPEEEWRHVGAILADEDPEGWAEDLALPTRFSPNLRMIPSNRSLSNREKDSADGIELRLKVSLQGLNADLVVIDCPNRQGGPLTLSALNAATDVIYAAVPTQDGVEGVAGARKSVAQFRKNMERRGVTSSLNEPGIILGNVHETILSRVAKNSIDELTDTGMLLTPIIPARTIVQEARINGEWYGDYRKGDPVVKAYESVLKKVI